MVISDVSQVLDFYPRPPRGGRHGRAGGVLLLDLFLSTPSARRATCSTGGRNTPSKHFYPRPPRGGRQFYDEEECLEHEFLSTPSARRATRSLALAFRSPRNFYPRPPRGGRLAAGACLDSDLRFLSTPSARRATHIGFIAGIYDGISIHALREEGDPVLGI